MSGPKDFVIVFAAARLAEMMARRVAMQQARAAEAQSRRQEIAGRMQQLVGEAAGRRSEVATRARRAANERLRVAAQENAKRLAAAEGTASARAKDEDATADQLQQVVSAAHDGLARLDQTLDCEGDSQREAFERALESLAIGRHDAAQLRQAEDLTKQILQTAEHVEKQHQRWLAAVASLDTWAEVLPGDECVRQFASAAAASWQEEVGAFKARKLSIGEIESLVSRAEALGEQAESIHYSAGDIRAKFDERNELLADILKSLQEIGFFVSDPIFENPSDPAGPVIIKATRGSEEVSASVDLSETIRSVWNGAADEKCKDSFFQYIDQMGKKGVEVKPTRADLQSHPVLKQVGAREVPRSSSHGEGR